MTSDGSGFLAGRAQWPRLRRWPHAAWQLRVEVQSAASAVPAAGSLGGGAGREMRKTLKTDAQGAGGRLPSLGVEA